MPVFSTVSRSSARINPRASPRQYLHLDSIRLEYGDYIVDHGGSQDTIQFGFRDAPGITDGWAVCVGGGWGRMLGGNASVPDGVTTQAGVGLKVPDGSVISIGFEGRFAKNDWRSHGGQVSIVFPF